MIVQIFHFRWQTYSVVDWYLFCLLFTYTCSDPYGLLSDALDRGFVFFQTFRKHFGVRESAYSELRFCDVNDQCSYHSIKTRRLYYYVDLKFIVVIKPLLSVPNLPGVLRFRVYHSDKCKYHCQLRDNVCDHDLTQNSYITTPTIFQIIAVPNRTCNSDLTPPFEDGHLLHS